MLTTLATATNERLTTVENAKEALRLTDSVDDEFVDRLIIRASRRIESYLNRPLTLRTYEAQLPSYGSPRLQLPRHPIHAVLGIYDGTSTGGAVQTDYTVDAEAGQLYRAEGWLWSRQTDRGALNILPAPEGEWRPWFVRWSAGYVGPLGTSSTSHGNTSTGPTLPEDIEAACLELVTQAYRGRGRAGDIKSETVGDVSVTYRDSAMNGLPALAVDLLQPYRSVL